MLQSPRKQHEAKQTENDMHGGWLWSNHVLLLFLFLKDNNALSRKPTGNLLCLLNLLLQVYEHKSAIISGYFLRTAGLGARVQNHKADANKPRGGSQRAREASLTLRLLPGNSLSTPLCSVLLFSLFTPWCLKKSKPKNLTDIFLSVRMFLTNAVIPRMWRLAWLWPQGGRTHEFGLVPPNTCISGEFNMCSRQKEKQ